MNAASSVLVSVVEADIEALVLEVVLISESTIVNNNVRVDVIVDVEPEGDGMTVTTAPFIYPAHE